MSETTTRETLEFKAELRQLLHLITHALYSNREIFLRELISNSSDAINKVRFDSLDDDAKLEDNKDWCIRVVPDREAGTLTIADNGIGMSRDTIVEDLGTIARSGTRSFIESLKAANATDRPGLIGQFGVGFYSAFMVADKVTVESRAAGLSPDDGVRWESDGQGEFSVEPLHKPDRGTRVILHLKEDAKDYLDPYPLRSLIKKFSDFVEHPIKLVTVEQKEDGESVTTEEQINTQKAIWLRNKSEVTTDEYEEFYKQLGNDDQPPAKVIHYAVEGNQEFRVLMYIPAHKPFTFDWQDPKPGLKLYIQRVLIMDPCEGLAPAYLRFVKGVLDSSDLPLNISRELLQNNSLLTGMRKSVVKNILDGLSALKRTEFEKYTLFFRELGSMLKEGLAHDWENREKLADLLLFESASQKPGELISLEQYVEKMPEDQEAIYYLIGDSREVLDHSPYLESFRAKGHDVLLLTDPLIDEYFTPHLITYKDKPLRPVDRGDTPDATEETVEGVEQFAGLLKALKEKLPEVKDVRLSKRLTDSACCLIGDATTLPPHLARMMERMGQSPDPEAGKRVLELNPNHPAVIAVRELFDASPDDQRIAEYAWLFHDQALIAEGSKVKDPAGFALRINTLLVKDASATGSSEA